MTKNIEVKSQKIYGSTEPVDGNFSLAFEFEPEDNSTLSTRGKFYITLSMESSSGVDLQLAAKLFVDTVKEHYFGDTDGTPLQSLETALNTGREKLFEIASSASNIPIKFDVICAVVWGSVLYIAQMGKTCALIIRGGEYTDISHKTGGDIMTSSGILEPEDVVIIASKAFEDEFLNDTLIQNLSNLESLFASSPNKALLSAVIISSKKNIFPSKKSFSDIVSKFKKKEVEKPSQIVTSTPLNKNTDETLNETTELVEDLDTPKISSLTDAQIVKESVAEKEEPLFKENAIPKDITEVSDEDSPEGNVSKKGRKKKKLFVSMLILVLGISSILIYGSVTKFSNKSNDVLVTDTAQKESRDSVDSTKSRSEMEPEVVTENLLFNFSTKDTNISISNFDVEKDTVVALDTENKNAYMLDVKDITNIVVKDLALNDSYSSLAYSDSFYYFISSLKLLHGKSPDSLVDSSLSSSIDGNIKGLIKYGPNFYVLTDATIYKIDSTYKVTSWANNLSQASSFSIDSNIFVNEGGKIQKYFKGEKQEFTIPDNVKTNSASLVYTDSDSKYLYILTDGILYSFDKTTPANAVELNTKLSNVVHIKVLGSNLYAATKSALYKIEIK